MPARTATRTRTDIVPLRGPRPDGGADTIASAIGGAVSRIVLHVHTTLAPEVAGRSVYELVSARVRQLPGLVSARWQVTGQRHAPRGGLQTVIVVMPVRLAAYADLVSAEQRMDEIDDASVVDLSTLPLDLDPLDVPAPAEGDVEMTVAAAHGTALAYVTRALSPVLAAPSVDGWHVTGALTKDAPTPTTGDPDETSDET